MKRACLVASSSRRSLASSAPSAGRIGYSYLELGQRSLHTSISPAYLQHGRSALSPAQTNLRFRTVALTSFARTLSTDPSQNTSAAGKTDTSPLLAPTAKKQKVELRPGPVKIDCSANSTKKAAASNTKVITQPPSSSTPHPTKPPPSPSTSFRKEALKEAEGKGIIEQTKNDIEDGTRHGILAPPPEGAGMARRLFHQAKELFKFYWAGLKYIRSHRQEAKRIQYRVLTGGAPLTWREHKFIMTNKSDMVKVVPFVLIALILEEVIPLIVMYIPGMLPSTCILPSQRLRIEAKRHERQLEAHELAKSSNAFNGVDVASVSLKLLEADKVTLLCNTVGISSFGITAMQRRRLRNWLIRLADEDKLLLAEGSGARLRQDEVSGALVDRGFLADRHSPAEERDRLRWWLDNLTPTTSGEKSATGITPEDARIQLLVHMLR